MEKSKLYLIPTPLAEGPLEDFLPSKLLQTVRGLDCFVVEELRTARRFLSAAGHKGHVEELELHELNEHSDLLQIEQFAPLFDNGRNVGLLSEAGLPAVADPGAALVALCHRIGVQVVPLVGPSSLMLALMCSGMNGQNFAFRGYLPAKTAERRKVLAEMEKLSERLSQSEIFIETPYRNDSMLEDIVNCCRPDTMLCLACDITGENEEILTKSISQWKTETMKPGKRPCVFILYASKGWSSSPTTDASKKKR